jgi:hypothetical protein
MRALREFMSVESLNHRRKERKKMQENTRKEELRMELL